MPTYKLVFNNGVVSDPYEWELACEIIHFWAQPRMWTKVVAIIRWN